MRTAHVSKFYFYFVGVALLFVLISPQSSDAAINPITWTCELLLETKNEIVLGSKNIWNSPYFLGALAKQAEIHDPENFGKLIYAPPPGMTPRWWHRFTRGYSIAPIRALDQNILDRPMLYVTRKWLNREYVPSFLVKFPIHLAVFAALVTPPYEAAYHALKEQREISVDANAHNERLYATLYRYDLRFRQFRFETQDKVKDKKLIRDSVSLWRSNIVAYLENLKTSKAISYEKYLENPIFMELKFISENGINPKDGFKVESTDKPTSETLNQVFLLEHKLQLQYEALFQAYQASNMKDVANGKVKLVNEYVNLPFWQKILSQLNRGLSPENVLSDLQEDLMWRTKFEQWKLFGATRLSRTETGQWTQTPLTIEKIESDILTDPKS